MMNRKSTTRPKLTEFSPELLESILAQIATAQTLSCLSQTCKGLHAYIEKDGYRIFVQRRFPTIVIPASAIPHTNDTKDGLGVVPDKSKFWKDAAHGLTTLSRNFDRRAFIAQPIQDPESKPSDATVDFARGRRQRGPTIGFIPVIDSYEAWYEAGWASRKEVVAWGAGAKLVMRSRTMEPKTLEDSAGERRYRAFKPHWRTYLKKGALEGRDDITTLNLIPQQSDRFEQLVLGRASGNLELLRLDETSANKTLATYNTNGMPVRYAVIPRLTGCIAAACLGDQRVALYPLNLEERDIEPCASASVQKPREKARTWSIKFLTTRRLAVGLGRSNHPIQIFDLGEGNLKFDRAMHLTLDEESVTDRLDVAGAVPHGTSIYSFASLSPSSRSSGAEGEMFLSGGYDAHVRLHDLRLSRTVVSLFSDPVDACSAVYSLLPIGCERFVAGGAMHSLMKVFDLRMPGQKMYHAAEVLPFPQKRPSASDEEGLLQPRTTQSKKYGNEKCCPSNKTIHTPQNWNVFLGTRNRGHERSFESPVYALTRPSSVSPTIYAGIQNCIMQLDIVSVLDQYPDPIYGTSAQSTKSMYKGPPALAARFAAFCVTQESKTDAAVKKWDPNQEVMNLPMYEQADQVKLMHQKPVRATCLQEEREWDFRGLDERWGGVSVNEEGRRGNISRRGI